MLLLYSKAQFIWKNVINTFSESQNESRKVEKWKTRTKEVIDRMKGKWKPAKVLQLRQKFNFENSFAV